MNAKTRPVAIWIFIGVAMLIIQVLLGGITRLTGSGLSITEWNIVTGTLPPVGEHQWMQEFDKYRQTPQYFLLNSEFSLADFKFIFFWEWLHRFWARLIAIAFLIPFIVFIVRKQINSNMVKPLLILFLLGALQGAIGWIMVASGLVGDAVYVKPTRLALHFVFALMLIAYAYWFALRLSVPENQRIARPALRQWSWFLIAVLFVQLVFGALMAGHKAATAAPTWPDINGSLIPTGLSRFQPLLINLIENKITIHFFHRLLAYMLVLLTFAWTLSCYRAGNATVYFRQSRWVPLALILVQLLLGIVAVLTSPSIIPNHWGIFEWMAQLHQVVAMLFLLSLVRMLYLTYPARP